MRANVATRPSTIVMTAIAAFVVVALVLLGCGAVLVATGTAVAGYKVLVTGVFMLLAGLLAMALN
jgi:hypothetical protein